MNTLERGLPARLSGGTCGEDQAPNSKLQVPGPNYQPVRAVVVVSVRVVDLSPAEQPDIAFSQRADVGAGASPLSSVEALLARARTTVASALATGWPASPDNRQGAVSPPRRIGTP